MGKAVTLGSVPTVPPIIVTTPVPAPQGDEVVAVIVLEPFTCEWAQDGLKKALDGLVAIGSGVEGYGIGTRWVRYRTAAEQMNSIDYWTKMVELYCGIPAPPSSVTGRDTAFRVVLRDV